MVTGGVEPGDIAIMLALAQAQQDVFPRRKSFKVWFVASVGIGVANVMVV